jgi:tellurite resistance protein TehA-like permease
MLTILVVILALVFSILARTVRDTLHHSPMLHGVALLGWLVGTFLMVKLAIDNLGDPSVTLGVGLFCISMVIVETVSILLPFVRERKSSEQKYNNRQTAYKAKIAGMTKRKVKMWWE